MSPSRLEKPHPTEGSDFLRCAQRIDNARLGTWAVQPSRHICKKSHTLNQTSSLVRRRKLNPLGEAELAETRKNKQQQHSRMPKAWEGPGDARREESSEASTDTIAQSYLPVLRHLFAGGIFLCYPQVICSASLCKEWVWSLQITALGLCDFMSLLCLDLVNWSKG